jgi:hypothetical protein
MLEIAELGFLFVSQALFRAEIQSRFENKLSPLYSYIFIPLAYFENKRKAYNVDTSHFA